MRIRSSTAFFILLSSVLTAQEQEGLREIRDPVPILSYGLWIATGVGGLLLGLLLWRLLRRRRRPSETAEAPPLPPPDVEAMSGLQRLRPLIREGRFEDFTVAASKLLRRYIERQFSVHAPEMTTEEFLPVASADPRLRGENADRLERFLERCDLVKFARQPLREEEMESLYQSAESFVRTTCSTPSAERPLRAGSTPS